MTRMNFVLTVDGHSSQYPWKDWLDGQCWLIRTHSDFTCMDTSLVSQAHTWGKLLGVAVAARLCAGGVLMQAYPMNSTWKPRLSHVDERKIRKALENPR